MTIKKILLHGLLLGLWTAWIWGTASQRGMEASADIVHEARHRLVECQQRDTD